MSTVMALASSAPVEPLHVLDGHTAGVNAIAFSPDGKTVAAGAWDQTIRLWDAATGGEIGQLLGHLRSVHAVAFSPDGATLASGALRVKLWDLATGKEIATLNGYGASVTSVAFSPDGMTLASGSLDHSVKLWRLSPDNGWEIHATLDAHTHGVRSIAFSPDGSLLASAGQDSTIRLWDVATGSTVRVLGEEAHGFYCSVAFSPDGRTLASGNADGSITLWDVNTGEVIRTIFRQGAQNWKGHTASALSIAFSPDGRLLASGSQDRTIKLWEVETGSILQTLTEHGNTVHSVAFSPDGRRLASASSDQTAKLWDLQGVFPDAHAITNVRFDPPSPATLGFNDRVTFTFDYTTTEPGGVYIWGTPFTGGNLPRGSAMHGSVLHPTGEGSLSGWFTIGDGAKTVDQVRFRMTDADRNVLYEAFVDVSYTYSDDEPTTEAVSQTEAPEEGEHDAGRVVELAYDRGEHDTGRGWSVADRGFAVRFTSPSEEAVLLTARLYVMRISGGPAPIRIHVWDADRVELIDPVEVTPTEAGWFDVDLSGLNLRPGDADFYVGYTQTQGDRYPFIGLEGAVPAERSYHVPSWSRVTLDGAGANLMIRVVVSVE